MRFFTLLAVAIFAPAIAAPALAQKAADKKAAESVLPQYKSIGGNPGPQYNYVCPNTDGKGGLDCYFDAVQHLYTMCRHIKSIEVIEFGYEKSEEAVNGAKSEYCVDKQKLNITRPYQAMETRRIGRRVQGPRRAALRRFPRTHRRHPQDRLDRHGKHRACAEIRP